MKKSEIHSRTSHILTLLTAFLLLSPIYAQRVSRCEDLGFDPIDPVSDQKILSIYLEGDDEGLGGLGCWVHHHPNNIDYVVTPHSWGRDPAPGKKGLIDDAMQAITDARNKYPAYGDMEMSLHYILDDVNRRRRTDDGITTTLGHAFWLVDSNSECWMQSGAPTLRSGSREDRKQVFAHEIGHCFVMKNVEHLDDYYSQNAWFDESVSEFLGSEVYPANNREHGRSRTFDMDGAVFRQPYTAYMIWYYYAKKNGIETVVPLMNRLASFSRREQRLDHLRSINFDRLFHEFLFDFYKQQIPDSGGTGPIPSETVIALRQPGEDLITPPSIPITLTSIPSERLSLYALYIPADYDLIIKPPINSSEKAFFSLVSENKSVKDWTSPEKIEGNCGSFTTVNILASHLQDEPVTGTKITYELKERENCCEEGLTVGVNPDENNLNGTFSFDHYIESDVNYKADGAAESIPMNYFVNSKDGSILLPKGWFFDNFGTDSSGDMEAEAVVWLANGQIVAYVNDLVFGQKRAITLDLNQTRENVMGIRAIKVAELLREGSRSGISPEPLPPGSQWNTKASGLAFNQPEMSDPSQINKVSAYISDSPTAITSPLPSFGFLVGYIRDRDNRNKKLVYTRVDLPDGDMFEAHLNKIEKQCASFDGHGYKKMTVGSSTGAIAAMTESEREAFVEDQTGMNEEMLSLLEEMSRCRGDKRCEEEVTLRMMELQRQQQDAYFDLPEEERYTGTAASDFEEKQRAIRDEMHVQEELIMDKEIRCDRLSRQNASCGGCMDRAVERCKRELEGLKEELYQLECKMAKLHGVEDMMEDCE